MSAPHPERLKHQFAIWVAAGGQVATWCRQQGVPTSTAWEWHRTAWFRRLVETYRRPMVDRAIGELVRNLSKSVDTVARLIGEGETDGIKLAAARTLIDSMLDVDRDTELKDGYRQLRDRIDAIDP